MGVLANGAGKRGGDNILMNEKTKKYNPNEVVVSVGGQIIAGFAEADFEVRMACRHLDNYFSYKQEDDLITLTGFSKCNYCPICGDSLNENNT